MVKRRFSFSKRFLTWKKLALIALGVFVAANASLTATYQSPSPFSQVKFPIVLGPVAVPTGYFPINRSAVTQFATDLISDYNNLLAYNQTNRPDFSNIQRFFSLYRPSGSFEVEVAKENVTYGDRLEFLFIPTQNANLKVAVFTNESAEYLRQVRFKISIAPVQTPYGVAIYQYYTESALGETLIPLIWITNSSAVYGNVALNANNAAKNIYRTDMERITVQLYPPYPAPRWWVNQWNYWWEWIIAFSVVFGIVTGFIYLRREGYLSRSKPPTAGTQRGRQPKRKAP